MTNFEKHIEKAAREYSLSSDEKARMERVLKSYMQFKPVRGGRSAPAAPVLAWTWIAYLHRPIAAALVLVLATSGTLTYAAESSLPGDALYTVKTKVSEPFRVALAPLQAQLLTGQATAEVRAEIQMRYAERRIEEATTLAAEGRLDETTEDDLAAAFEMRAEAAANAINVIEEGGDSPASAVLASRFETKLAAHEDVLAEVEFEDEDDRDTPRSHRLSEALRNASERIAIAREQRDTPPVEIVADISAASATEDATLEPAAATLMSAATTEPPANDTRATASTKLEVAAEQKPAPSEKAISRMKTAAEKSLKNAEYSLRKARALSADAKARAEADIARADALLEEGNDYRDNDAAADAYASYKESLRTSEQTTVHIKAAPSLEKLRVRNASRNRRSESNEPKSAETSIDISLPGASVNATVTAPTSSSENSTSSDSDDGPAHDASDDRGEDDPAHDAGDDHGGHDETDDESNNDSQKSEEPSESGFKFLQKLNISL